MQNCSSIALAITKTTGIAMRNSFAQKQETVFGSVLSFGLMELTADMLKEMVKKKTNTYLFCFDLNSDHLFPHHNSMALSILGPSGCSRYDCRMICDFVVYDCIMIQA